jgi:type VI protein secretion system component VasF
MTELDDLLSRLRKLEPIALDRELEASLQARARRRVRGPVRSAPLASLALIGTVFVYLGWALHFTRALYP